MNEVFYAVTFEQDCSSYFFHNQKRARDFIWEAYCDDFENGRFDFDAYDELYQYNSIENYAWIEVCEFEDTNT